jgi:uncharacterized membrane protein
MKRTMMKSASISAIALVAAFAGAQTVQVTVDGQPVTFDAAQPQVVRGRVLVPLRSVFEQIGAAVNWDPSTQTITADGHGRHVVLQIGSFDANVNGRAVALDVPPQVMDDTTMVPLRFLGQSLGDIVDWQPQNDMVALRTRTERSGAAQRIAPPPPAPTPPPPVIVPPPVIIEERPAPPPIVVQAPPPPPPERPIRFTRDTVIPMTLDEPLSSNGNHQGDHFTATVRGDSGRYLDFPDGTTIEGFVRSATSASGSHAGTLDVRFTELKFSDGSEYRLGGYVTMLNDKGIVRTNDGRFVAKEGSNSIARDATYGAGAGFVIGSTRGKAVGGAAIGGVLGSIVGAFDHNLGRNVNIDQGTRFGLVLDKDLMIKRHDLRDR